MAQPVSIPGDLVVKGNISCQGINLGPDTIGNEQIDLSDPIELSKQRHKIVAKHVQKKGASVASITGEGIHIASFSGTVLSVRAFVGVAGVTWAGGGQLTVDLKKNGTTVLSTLATITGSTLAYAAVDATINTSLDDYVVDDVFTVVVAVTAGTGTLPQDLCVIVTFDEEGT